jgi:hypothetical protein
MDKPITQNELLIQFFKQNPNRDIPHPEIVDWVVTEYHKLTGLVFRDPDRGIRKLHQNGFLIKVAKGVYKYDPNYVHQSELEDFSSTQKKKILERDGYKCVLCGKGLKEGVELHIDHIKAKDKGGKATIDNGQVLCAQHNIMKKNLGQTESGKKMFIKLYELAKQADDETLHSFFAEVLEVFEKHGINGHIDWKK